MKPARTWAWSMVFEDLTELERAQRLAAWREVARRIAHEVKNPLTPIKLAAQRLQRRYVERLGEDEPGLRGMHPDHRQPGG